MNEVTYCSPPVAVLVARLEGKCSSGFRGETLETGHSPSRESVAGEDSGRGKRKSFDAGGLAGRQQVDDPTTARASEWEHGHDTRTPGARCLPARCGAIGSFVLRGIGQPLGAHRSGPGRSTDVERSLVQQRAGHPRSSAVMFAASVEVGLGVLLPLCCRAHRRRAGPRTRRRCGPSRRHCRRRSPERERRLTPAIPVP